MKMPIVSMNKMAMNESVATTCCYRQVPTASVVYWEVLHGGWIGKGYVEKLNFSTGFTGLDGKNIMKALYDFKGASVTTLAGTSVEKVAYNGNAEQWYFWPEGFPTDTDPVKPSYDVYDFGKFLGASVISCKHDTQDCIYKEYAIELVDNYHFDATSAHGGITKWAQGHSVAGGQYSS